MITPGDHPLGALANSLGLDGDSLIEDPNGLHKVVSRVLCEGVGVKMRKGEISSEHPRSQAPPRLLLVADQFEELFTLCQDEVERKAFVDNLLTAASHEIAGLTVVVIELRADFYGHCAEYANLREALATNQEFIGPVTPE